MSLSNSATVFLALALALALHHQFRLVEETVPIFSHRLASTFTSCVPSSKAFSPAYTLFIPELASYRVIFICIAMSKGLPSSLAAISGPACALVAVVIFHHSFSFIRNMRNVYHKSLGDHPGGVVTVNSCICGIFPVSDILSDGLSDRNEGESTDVDGRASKHFKKLKVKNKK